MAAISVALPDRTLATTATCFGPEDATALTIQPDDPVNVDAGQKVEFSASAKFPDNGDVERPVPAAWSSSARRWSPASVPATVPTC